MLRKNKAVKVLLTWWGQFRFMFQFLGFYLSVISLAMTAVTAYNTTLRDWAILYLGFDLKLWTFALLLVGFMVLGMVVEKVITVPYLLSKGNEEAYKHGNPMRLDLESIKVEQAEAMKRESERDQRICNQDKKLDEILSLLKTRKD